MRRDYWQPFPPLTPAERAAYARAVEQDLFDQQQRQLDALRCAGL